MNNPIGIHCCYFLFLLLSPEILLAVAQPGTNGFSDPNYNRFNPSMAIIIVILVAALFLMGFFSIYIRRCADSPSNSGRPLTGGAAGRSRRAARGLDPEVIETFPTLQYSEVKIHKIGKDTLECAVCLNEFEETETLRLIPKCDHVFHPECIDEWLASHTTCPVCRANLVPQPGESLHGVPVLNPDPNPESHDIEAPIDAVGPPYEQQNAHADGVPQEAEELPLNKTLNRNRTRGSMSSRKPRFPRSHTTGHSLVQPGEDTERFTLRLPAEVRKRILNRELHRTRSLVVLPREGSSRRGYRTGGEGSSRGRLSRRLDRSFKSDRWVFTMAPPFLVRASSIRSPKVSSNAGEGASTSTLPILPPSAVDSSAPPV